MGDKSNSEIKKEAAVLLVPSKDQKAVFCTVIVGLKKHIALAQSQSGLFRFLKMDV